MSERHHRDDYEAWSLQGQHPLPLSGLGTSHVVGTDVSDFRPQLGVGFDIVGFCRGLERFAKDPLF